MDRNKNNKGFLKCLLAGMVIVSFVCFVHVSGAPAQWPPYGNAGWPSQAFFGSPFFSLSPISGYRGSFDSGSPTPYGNYPPPASSPGLWSRGGYGNYSYNDIFTPYSSRFLPSGAFVGPAFSPLNSADAGFFPQPAFPLFSEPAYAGQPVQGWPYGGPRYAGSAGYNPYYPGIGFSPFIPNTPNPYTLNSAWYFPWTAPPSSLPPAGVPLYGWWSIIKDLLNHETEPINAPGGMGGEWQSQQLTDEDGNKIKGKLGYVLDNDLLEMSDSSLPLGEGELTEFEYTPTLGEAPISFKGVFDSGYTAYFSGTAYNRGSIWDYFDIEGTYEIKDNEGQIADRGTFSFGF